MDEGSARDCIILEVLRKTIRIAEVSMCGVGEPCGPILRRPIKSAIHSVPSHLTGSFIHQGPKSRLLMIASSPQSAQPHVGDY